MSYEPVCYILIMTKSCFTGGSFLKEQCRSGQGLGSDWWRAA